MQIAKIASLNINGISAKTRIEMLMSFIRRHDIDILLLQEVTNPEPLNISGYLTHINVGTEMWGTAILSRNDISLTNIATLPSGRAIAADFNGIRIINIYAPSGTARRKEREDFFNLKLPELLYPSSRTMLLGGDFNCILQPIDTTGPFTTSRAFSEIVRGFTLAYTWQQDPNWPVFTHYSPTGATRIDRIYMSRDLMARKTGIVIVPPAFTDHFAIIFRIRAPHYEGVRRRARWKTDPVAVQDGSLKAKIRDAMIK
jgi:exonuclease III